MKIDFNRKYTTISAYCVITFAICLALVIFCLNFPTISGWVKAFFKAIAPVTWGVVIAYIANPVMKFFERLFTKLLCKKKPHPKLCRYLSVFISMLLLIAVVVTLVTVVVIQVIGQIMEVLNSVPTYISQVEAFVNKQLDDYPQVVEYLNGQLDTIQKWITDMNIIAKIGEFSVKIKDGALGFVGGLKNFVIGLIVSVYLLISKETFLAQARKIVYALFPKNLGRNILRLSAKTNSTLSGFISGKLLDSLIIGCFCFIGMRIMNMEFTVLISVVIGVTNIIPFFGPLFGAIPSALLLLLAAPKQVIPFVIFVVVLQQVDGNLIGPKILGDSTGLSAFWVMFAIFVGGGLFGFAGMILGVPLFAVVYALISEFIAYMLRKRKLSHRTVDYHDFDINDPPPAPVRKPAQETETAEKTKSV